MWTPALLMEAYDSARDRNPNKAIQLYSEVTTLLDYLEGDSEPPVSFDVEAACDSLAYRLRQVR